MLDQHVEVGLEKQICGWRCGVQGVRDGGGRDDETFPSGVRLPGRGAGDECHVGDANL